MQFRTFISKNLFLLNNLKRIKVFAIDIDGTITENGGGMVHLPAIENLRYLERLGYKIIYVSGRSSVEAYILSVFSGTTKIAVGENGGAVTLSPQEHILLADKENCLKGYEILKQNIEGAKIKPVFPRFTEIVLLRTFDIAEGQKILNEHNLDLHLSDSGYAFHINERRVDKARGLKKVLDILNVTPAETVAIGDSQTDIPLFDLCGYSIALNHAEENVKARARYVVSGKEGEGLIDAIEYIALNYFGEGSLIDISAPN
jgi:phosphoglycolate phosphatase (TIGR01487 family)